MPLPLVALTAPTVVTVVEPEPKFSASMPNRASIVPLAVTLTSPAPPALIKAATIPALPAWIAPLATTVTSAVAEFV